MPYNEILVSSMSDLAREVGLPLPDSVAEPFGNSVGTWRAYGDTVAGLQKLAKHYSKLIILSNVDNASIAMTVDRQLNPVEFAAVYTAQDIGSYKPARANFEYLFEHAKADLGVDWQKGELLHVARGLHCDHVPAKELGLRSVWISRGRGDELGAYKDVTAFEWRFETIGEFADEVERQFASKETKKS
jgi:2-haloalkanoic acid dehalogenase type II